MDHSSMQNNSASRHHNTTRGNGDIGWCCKR
jgi:hypothetical protein